MTRRTTLVLLLILGSLPGCQTYRHTRQASEAVSLQNWDAAVYHYLEAMSLDPTNPRLRMELQRARLKAGEEHFRLGMRFREVSDLRRAEQEFALAVQLDPTHQYAEVELRKVRAELEIRDRRDAGREHAPLKAAEDAVSIDTTDLSPEEVVARMLAVLELKA